MAEIYRVLKPGGLLALTFDFGEDLNIKEEKLQSSLICITGVDEIIDLYTQLPFEVRRYPPKYFHLPLVIFEPSDYTG